MRPVSLLEAALSRAAADLTALKARWALVGGLAVAARAEPRTTRDLDFAVAVSSEQEADDLIRALRDRGYQDGPHAVRLRVGGGIAVVRLLPPGYQEGGVVVDLLFDLARIEREVVSGAENLFVTPRLAVPVARVGHLLALKLVASRPMDLFDARKLLDVASDRDLRMCREALELITRRNGHDGRDLNFELERLLAEDPGLREM